mmetsp:Transcript_99861/g.279675  ORF Transcript_99861/g.279675 Transcript_99861/m.279675 type:complete len:236 (+) Transcript_99861:437-1144(+)
MVPFDAFLFDKSDKQFGTRRWSSLPPQTLDLTLAIQFILMDWHNTDPVRNGRKPIDDMEQMWKSRSAGDIQPRQRWSTQKSISRRATFPQCTFTPSFGIIGCTSRTANSCRTSIISSENDQSILPQTCLFIGINHLTNGIIGRCQHASVYFTLIVPFCMIFISINILGRYLVRTVYGLKCEVLKEWACRSIIGSRLHVIVHHANGFTGKHGRGVVPSFIYHHRASPATVGTLIVP